MRTASGLVVVTLGTWQAAAWQACQLEDPRQYGDPGLYPMPRSHPRYRYCTTQAHKVN